MKAFAPKSTPATPARRQDRQRPASQDGLSAEAANSRLAAWLDNRPEAMAQRQLQAIVEQSPQVQRLAQLQAMIDNSPRQVAQRQQWAHLVRPPTRSPEDEAWLPGKGQDMANPSPQGTRAAPLQAMAEPCSGRQSIHREENTTGLPDNLKAGIEHLSGYSLHDVQVHYNSNKPAHVQAYAYTQGTAIHLAPGQEKHLPHEAWHVIQQKQGRVRPTMHLAPPRGSGAEPVPINDDEGLEQEAEVMGGKALQSGAGRTSLETRGTSGQVSSQPIVQRAVLKVRKGPNAGKFYTDSEPIVSKYFDTYEEAYAYQRSLIEEGESRKKEEQARKKEAVLEERRAILKRKYKDYEAPESETARLYKNKDKDYDDVVVTTLDAENAKSFMEKQFEERRAGLFATQVITLGGYHYVIAPGTDIGLTPALLRPDKAEEGEDRIPLSREGKPKPYDDLSKGLDAMVTKYAKKGKERRTRMRIGKDIDRMTRGNDPRGDLAYSTAELRILNEVAAVLRLDKGRVPRATSYIRETITAGEHSFKQLLVDKYYVGAGSGGVEALRGKAKDGGHESEGSDLSEQEDFSGESSSVRKKQKTARKKAGKTKPQLDAPVATEYTSEAAHDIREFDTWNDADFTILQQGQRIRILHHHPDISERVFMVKVDYDPSALEYPSLEGYVDRIA